VPEQVRYPLIVWGTMQVMDVVRARIQPTPYESEPVKSGGVRWEVVLHFKSGDAVTVGWMTKRGGWALVEAGIQALEAFPGPDQLYAELQRRYREIDQQRKQAMQALNGVQQFITQALDGSRRGSTRGTTLPCGSPSWCCARPRSSTRRVRWRSTGFSSTCPSCSRTSSPWLCARRLRLLTAVALSAGPATTSTLAAAWCSSRTSCGSPRSAGRRDRREVRGTSSASLAPRSSAMP
jgi:hypothetical protein